MLPAIVIQILQSIKELVCHTFDNKKNSIPKLALEIQDISLLALLLSPRLDDTNLEKISAKEAMDINSTKNIPKQLTPVTIMMVDTISSVKSRILLNVLLD